MRLLIIPLVIVILIIVGTDLYIWKQIKGRGCRLVWILTAVLCWALLAWSIMRPLRSGDTSLLPTMWVFFGLTTVYVVKWCFALFSIAGKIFRLRRFKPGFWIGLPLGLVLFGMLWWGALVTRHSLQVNEITVRGEFPQEFNGFRIAQFSDAHVGSWGNDTVFLSNMVEKINSLHPDIIIFTGDVVNRNSSELIPFTTVMQRLKAPHGVWSILGNHDYGVYQDWPSQAAADSNINRLRLMEREMGWQLLENAAAPIAEGQDTIWLVGSGNWDMKHGHHFADLNKALQGVPENASVVLLTHNPQHWDSEEVRALHPALTLSGHTHAMQFRIGSHSPSSLLYPHWWGKAEKDGMTLYVNGGCGEVAFPARVGATPEITLITLQSDGPKSSNP